MKKTHRKAHFFIWWLLSLLLLALVYTGFQSRGDIDLPVEEVTKQQAGGYLP